jgi:hypothetical protein
MPNPRPKLNPRYPQPGQIGFWKDREAALRHARTVLCAAGGRVSGKKTIAYAQAAFEAKYPGCTIADVRKGRAFLEQKAAAVRAREMSVMEAEAAERKAESGEDGGGFAVFG